MALFADDEDDPLSSENYDPFAKSIPTKKKEASTSLFNDDDTDDEDLFKTRKPTKKNNDLFADEDEDDDLTTVRKSKEKSSDVTGTGLADFDFSKLDKLGTGKKKGNGKKKKEKKEHVDTGPKQRGGARTGGLGIGHNLDEFDLSLKKKRPSSTTKKEVVDDAKGEVSKEVGLFEEDIFEGDIDDPTSTKSSNLLDFLDDADKEEMLQGDDDKEKKKVKKSKDLFAEDDDIDVDDLKTTDLMVAKLLTTETDDAGGLIRGKSSIQANIKTLAEKTDDSVLKIDADDTLNILENATKDKSEGDGVEDLFADLNFGDKDAGGDGGDDLFAQIAALEKNIDTSGNADLSSIDEYIKNETSGGSGLFD